MPLPREIFMFFLTNEIGQCYYVDGSGRVQLSNVLTELQSEPEGWRDQVVSFGRNQRYYGLNRSYTQPLKFVKDGARIIRWLMYQGSGIEEKLYLNVNKFNNGSIHDGTEGIYRHYYKGEVDLTQADDTAFESVTVPIMEGGLAKLIKAYESTMYEIPCDGSIPENINVKIDGIEFNAIFNYGVVPCAIKSSGTVLPLALQTVQGNDVGIVKGVPTYAEFDGANTAAATETQNGFFTSVAPVTLTFPTDGSSYLEFSGSLSSARVEIVSNLQSLVLIPLGPIVAGQKYTLSGSITAAAGEQLFLIVTTTDPTPNCGVIYTPFVFQFNSRFQDTNTYAIRPYDLLNLLLQRICQDASTPNHNINYTLQSDLLRAYSNLTLTSGSALRNQANAVIKTCIADFFQSFDAVLWASLGNQGSDEPFGENLFLESRDYVFDSSSVTMELGEVSKFKIAPALDYIYSSIKIGYPEQKYSEADGNYEFNTTAQFKTPVKKINKELTAVSKYRGDSFGVEYTRFLIQSSTATNNASDKDVFFLNVDLSRSDQTEVDVTAPTGQNIIHNEPNGTNSTGLNMPQFNTLISGGGIAAEFEVVNFGNGINSAVRYNNTVAAVAGHLTLSMSFYFFGQAYIPNYPGSTSYPTSFNLMVGNRILKTQRITLHFLQTYSIVFDMDITLSGGDTLYIAIVPDDYNYFNGYVQTYGLTFATSALSPVYSLLREIYASEPSGFINPTSAYNIANMTPMRMLTQRWGAYIRSGLYNLTGQNLKFQMLDKNSQLSTIYPKDPVTGQQITITESEDVPISSLNPNLKYLPWILKFTTEVPLTFQQLQDLAANAHIHGTIMGQDFYGFPLSVSQKPALNESQDWELLMSPLTNLADLWDLNMDGLMFLDMPQNSATVVKTCPLQFVPRQISAPDYDATGVPFIDDDFFANQVRLWPAWGDRDSYLQKWQNTDSIDLQVITKGLDNVVVTIVNTDNVVVVSGQNLGGVTDPVTAALGLSLFQGSISLSSLDPGVYFILLSAGDSEDDTQNSNFVSEPIHVAEKWPGTLLFRYTNSVNDAETIFSQGYNPSFRVEGWISEPTFKSKRATYEDEPADVKILRSVPYRSFKLHVGRDRGIPDWISEKINIIMGLDTVTIRGMNIDRAFVADGSGELAMKKPAGWPMGFGTMDIRDAQTRGSLTITSTGQVNQGIEVIKPIDGSAFGDGSNASGIIDVTEVD